MKFDFFRLSSPRRHNQITRFPTISREFETLSFSLNGIVDPLLQNTEVNSNIRLGTSIALTGSMRSVLPTRLQRTYYKKLPVEDSSIKKSDVFLCAGKKRKREEGDRGTNKRVKINARDVAHPKLPNEVSSLSGFFDDILDESNVANEKERLHRISLKAKEILSPLEYLIRPSSSKEPINGIYPYTITYMTEEQKIRHTRGFFSSSGSLCRWVLATNNERIYQSFDVMMADSEKFKSYTPVAKPSRPLWQLG